MKRTNLYSILFVGILISIALFARWLSRPQTVISNHTASGREFADKIVGSTADMLNDKIIAKSKDRYEKAANPPQEELADNPPLTLIDEEGELNEKALGSQGLSEEQIGGIKEALNEISTALYRHFTNNCEEILTKDGSYIYILKGDPGLSLALQDEMRIRLGEAIGSGLSGSKLANQITTGLKGRALLNYGADDMIGAAFRDVNKEGTGWEDGIRINGAMPGMIDHYRKNGWPGGDVIHASNGKAIFHPSEKP